MCGECKIKEDKGVELFACWIKVNKRNWMKEMNWELDGVD